MPEVMENAGTWQVPPVTLFPSRQIRQHTASTAGHHLGYSSEIPHSSGMTRGGATCSSLEFLSTDDAEPGP